MSLQSLLQTCFITRETVLISLQFFALYMFHSMDCMNSFEPPPGGTLNEFPVFVTHLYPHFVQNIDLELPNGDNSNA